MRKDSKLPLRLLSAAIFLPLLLWLIRGSGTPYFLYTLVLLGFAAAEFFRMGEEPLSLAHTILGLAATLSGPLSWSRTAVGVFPRLGTEHALVNIGVLLAATLAALLWDACRGKYSGSIRRAGHMLLGSLYIGGLGGYLLLLGGGQVIFSGTSVYRDPRAGESPGWAAVTLVYALTWTNDTFAYLAGLLFGRTPLSPISPSKTREGALGGLAATILLGYVLGSLAFPWLGAGRGAILGGLVSVAAQVGDLLESMWKRDLGSKDSGSLIPGHGGVLDRFDSLLLAAPVVYYFLRGSSLI